MLTYIIFVIVLFLIFIFLARDSIDHLGEVFFVFLFAIVLSLIPTLLISGIVPDDSNYEESVQSYELRSLGGQSQEISGFFFLGSGRIDDDRVLRYKIEDDGVALKSVLAEDDARHSVRIHDSGDVSPRVEIATLHLNKESKKWFFESSSFTKYRFYAPEGTVVENYFVE